MKILHVIATIAPHYGGPSNVVRLLSAQQVKNGHEVTICTTNLDFPRGTLHVPTHEPVTDQGVTFWFHKLSPGPLYFSWSLASWLIRHLRTFEILHVHGLYRFPPTFAAALARYQNIPYLIQPHGALDPFLYQRSDYSLVLKRGYERLFDFPNMNGAQAIHYTSEEERERTRFLSFRAPSVVVSNGLDWADFEKLPEPNLFRTRLGVGRDQPLVLFLGRLNFKKGLDLLIPAFAKTARELSEAVLVIVGPDNEGLGKQVRQWCREHQILERVLLVDHIPSEETRQAYVDADVFVLPSYTENFGMTVVEAMACQCPVVVSDQVNIWEAVDGAGAGLVTSLDVDSIGQAMTRILQDRDLAKKMGSAGRSLVKERFVWESIIEKLDGIYLDILKRHHNSSEYGRR